MGSNKLRSYILSFLFFIFVPINQDYEFPSHDFVIIQFSLFQHYQLMSYVTIVYLYYRGTSSNTTRRTITNVSVIAIDVDYHGWMDCFFEGWMYLPSYNGKMIMLL